MVDLLTEQRMCIDESTNGSGVATLSGVSLAGINAGSYPTGVGASFAGDGSFVSSL